MKQRILAANARYSTEVEALLLELASIDHDCLNRIPVGGGWSAMQTLHHLILVEENSMAYINKKLSFNPTLKKAGFGAWFRSLLLGLTLRSAIKFKAPKSAGSERIPEISNLKEAAVRWQAIRAEWRIFFEKMPLELTDKTAYKHPRAGRLNWLQMIDFLHLHFERHRSQIRRAVS